MTRHEQARLWVAFFIALPLFVVFGRALSGASRRSSPLPSPQARAWMNVDVSVVRIAIDAGSREFLQGEMARFARGDMRSAGGRHAALLGVVRLLRKCDAAWVMGGASNHHPMSAPIAEGIFRKHAQSARAMFMHELVRNASGELVTRASPGFVPSATEGGGAALITLVIAARREIRDFVPDRPSELHAVLDDLERLTERDLVAMEVIWMPADPDDRVSTATLAALDPSLVVLPSARAGRVRCAYCRGPFTAELPTCPHCGAAAPPT